MIEMCDKICPSGFEPLKGKKCNGVECNGKNHTLTVIIPVDSVDSECDECELKCNKCERELTYYTWWKT